MLCLNPLTAQAGTEFITRSHEAFEIRQSATIRTGHLWRGPHSNQSIYKCEPRNGFPVFTRTEILLNDEEK